MLFYRIYESVTLKPGDMSGDEEPQIFDTEVYTSGDISNLAGAANSDVELEDFPLGA